MYEASRPFFEAIVFAFFGGLLIYIAAVNRGRHWPRRIFSVLAIGVIVFGFSRQWPVFAVVPAMCAAYAVVIISVNVARLHRQGRGGRTIRTLESIRRALAYECPLPSSNAHESAAATRS